VCNLYSITTNQEAIRALFRVVNRYVGNLAPMPGVFPDYPAPVGTQRGHRARTSDEALGNAAAALNLKTCPRIPPKLTFVLFPGNPKTGSAF
jgi:hypothetical protein